MTAYALTAGSMALVTAKTASSYSPKRSLQGVAFRPHHRHAQLAPTVRHRGPARVNAMVLPPLVPVIARAVTAGVLFYASMNWVYFRGFRKQAEKEVEEFEKKEDARRKKINKMTSGKASNDNQK